MTIDTNLLIAAPMLQDYFVDKDGTPLSGGVITCYHDDSRTTLKNWYYQSGSPGSYEYIRLPNPLTLSAAGTICTDNVNGIDVIPFFYPYSELDENEADPYFITVVNHNLTLMFSRENFPFNPNGGGNTRTVSTFNNLIVNNGFWRNIAPNTLGVSFTDVALNDIVTQDPITMLYSAIVSPSQHDGFRMPDVQFVKNNVTGSDMLTFVPFPLGNSQPIQNYIVPEYYINHVCNTPGSSENIKVYQFPISLHVNTLEDVAFTVGIQAQLGGSGGTTISLSIFQDTGTGTVSPAAKQISAITLSSSWTQYIFTGVFPSTAGLALGTGADDALYLQVEMPINVACNINFTKPSIYLTQGLLPNNDFQSYDQVDSIINSPRTGDVRTSINAFSPFGWVPMNDGSIGGPTSTATARKNSDTFSLFNLLWNYSKPYDTGSNFNPICQMYTSVGSLTNYGSNSITDFNAGKSLALTKSMTRVMMGTVPISSLLPGATGSFKQTFSATNSAGLLTFTGQDGSVMYQGQTITFSGNSLPSGVSPNTVYYVTNINFNVFNVSTTYANAIARGPVLGWASDGSGTLFLDLAGSITGEPAHVQQFLEVGAHTHDFTGVTASAPPTIAAGGSAGFGIRTTQVNSPNSSASNITQWGTFYNMFMKL